jgi:hypothetical protein
MELPVSYAPAIARIRRRSPHSRRRTIIGGATAISPRLQRSSASSGSREVPDTSSPSQTSTVATSERDRRNWVSNRTGWNAGVVMRHRARDRGRRALAMALEDRRNPTSPARSRRRSSRSALASGSHRAQSRAPSPRRAPGACGDERSERWIGEAFDGNVLVSSSTVPPGKAWNPPKKRSFRLRSTRRTPGPVPARDRETHRRAQHRSIIE